VDARRGATLPIPTSHSEGSSGALGAYRAPDEPCLDAQGGDRGKVLRKWRSRGDLAACDTYIIPLFRDHGVQEKPRR